MLTWVGPLGRWCFEGRASPFWVKKGEVGRRCGSESKDSGTRSIHVEYSIV